MKDFLNRLWNGFLKTKKGMMYVGAAVLLCGIGAGIYGTWLHQQPKFQDVTVELGTESVQITQFMTKHARLNKVSFASDLSVIDLNQVGQTEVTLRHGNQEETVLFRVQDTTAPEVEFVTVLTEAEGYVPAPEDFVDRITDADETTVSFVGEVVIPEDYSDTSVTVAVSDQSGNTTQQTCKLTFSWYRRAVNLEYGQHLTKADLLLTSDAEESCISQERINEINQSPVGTYSVEVTTDEGVEICTVTVRDTTGPELKLRDLCIGTHDDVEAEDFVAYVSDTSGGVCLNLKTPLVTGVEGQRQIIIEAVDIYGNATEQAASLLVSDDDEAPKISFTSDYIQVNCGSTPNFMTGVTVTDNEDENCTVVYDSTDVDLNEIGTYKITYTATDRAGNTTTKKRKIEVTFQYEEGPLSEKAQAIINKHAAKLSDDPEEIRDYVREKIRYNTNWGGEDPIVYGFSNRKGNCYVHALCLKALLEAKGHETQLIWVEDHTHYWLVIKIGDTWRHIDATPSRGYHNKYSLMTDEQRYSTLKGRDWDRDLWPACE